jgi:hypothetical protein
MEKDTIYLVSFPKAVRETPAFKAEASSDFMNLIFI